MPSISFGPNIDRRYRDDLELILDRVATLFMLDLLVTGGRKTGIESRERGEELHRVGRALDFQVRGYQPLGKQQLDRIFFQIIRHTHQIIEGIVDSPACCQFVLHPGNETRGAHIHLALSHSTRRIERIDSVVLSLENRTHLRRGTPTPVILIPNNSG